MKTLFICHVQQWPIPPNDTDKQDVEDEIVDECNQL
jgi:hypothetical protein